MKSPLHRRLMAATAMIMALSVSPLLAMGSPSQIAADAPLAAPETSATTSQVMPNSFADLVEEVSPAVVNITTTAMVSAPTRGGPGFPEGSPFADLFRDFGFPGQPPGFPPFGQSGPRQSSALGSGFVIAPDGYVVTNNHVIEGADEIEIEFRDGIRRKATVVGTDPKTDIALLKVDADNLPYVEFGNSDTARVGDWVLALGNPLGQGFSASTGIVSARNRELSGTYDDFIQTDAAINRGNSGGPLFDMDGKVIGVNTAILSPNGGSIGIGFSMASNVVGNVVEQLKEFGATRRGYLGVTIQDITAEMADALGLEKAEGALVNDVPAGPAEDAGIKAGDIVVSFNNKPVSDTRELVRRVADGPVGEAMPITVLREGELIEMKITLGRREVAEGTAQEDGEEGAPQGDVITDVMGLMLETLTPNLAGELRLPPDVKGLVVRSVDPSGAAAQKGVLPADVITNVNQIPVSTLEELNTIIDEAREAGRKSVLALLRRGGQPYFVALPVE